MCNTLDDLQKLRMKEVCELMRSDIQRDLLALEGKEFNAHTVGNHFGLIAAQIESLTNMVEKLIDLH